MRRRAQKKIDADQAVMESWLEGIGAVRAESSMYPWRLGTPFGMLEICPAACEYDPRENMNHWVYTSFGSLTPNLPNVNPYSGKWNHHLSQHMPIEDQLAWLEREWRHYGVIPADKAA
jgi:hypothetical protein